MRYKKINFGNVCHFAVLKFNFSSTFQNAEDQDIENKFATSTDICEKWFLILRDEVTE
jgi:hypothetical protein